MTMVMTDYTQFTNASSKIYHTFSDMVQLIHRPLESFRISDG